LCLSHTCLVNLKSYMHVYYLRAIMMFYNIKKAITIQTN
jgi:hypothetical protein